MSTFKTERPNGVGIVAIEVYFPRTYVSQSELEKHDSVGEGKYTIGLGQTNMAFLSDREDIYSMALTVVSNLLEKNQIDKKKIGRLEVGTETIIDKSKSIKSVLMQLFQDAGNNSIEGIDTMNACYGGTNALFNAVHWMESSYWDGRYAIVVAGDIAVYAAGPARPTGGAGIVAMLIGPDAPLVLESGLRATHMEHSYDFYKPQMTKEFPTVDGSLTISCYLRALDNCYLRYKEAFCNRVGKDFDVSSADFFVFHSPFNKLVQKSFGRLLYLDTKTNPSAHPDLVPFTKLSETESYTNRDLESLILKKSKSLYDEKVAPSTLLSKQLGNSYCGSVYASLAALLEDKSSQLVGKRIVMFSYGSGFAASMFSLKVEKPVTSLTQKLQIKSRLSQRIKVEPAEFTQILKAKEEKYGANNQTSSGEISTLFPDTYYLLAIDDKYRRTYAKKPMSAL